MRQGNSLYGVPQKKEIECSRCGNLVDRSKVHTVHYERMPHSMAYDHYCEQCMKIIGKRCAKCHKLFLEHEGRQVDRLPSQPYYDDYPKHKLKFQERYGGEFLCEKCYNMELYGTEKVVKWTTSPRPAPVPRKF